MTDVRLPTALTPLEYDVELKPDFYGDDPEAFSLQGSVTIRMKCVESTNNITVHINKLTVDPASVSVRDAAGGEIAHNTPREDKDRQFYIIPLPQSLTPGQEYTVSMTFTGPLKDDLKGLYLSQYKRGNQTVYVFHPVSVGNTSINEMQKFKHKMHRRTFTSACPPWQLTAVSALFFQSYSSSTNCSFHINQFP